MFSRNYFEPLEFEVSYDSPTSKSAPAVQPDPASPSQHVRYQHCVPFESRTEEALERHYKELLERKARAERCNLCKWCTKLDLGSLRHGRKPFEWDLFELIDGAHTTHIKGYFGHPHKRRNLTITSSFQWQNNSLSSPTAKLSSPAAKPYGTGCPLCRVIRQICREVVPEKDDFEVSILLKDAIPMCLHDCDNSEPWSTVDIVVSIGTIRRTVTLMPLLNATGPEGPTRHNCMAKHALPLVADFDRLNDWIRGCDSEHRHEVLDASLEAPLPSVRFIDIKNRCLVIKSLSSRFAALSYTWGSCWQFQLNKEWERELEEKDSLSRVWNDLSKVVTDAIAACERLLIPYLWIDTLCIVNDDENEKHDQIANMNMIYSSAYVALIAAAGSDANAGLPRVSKQIAQKTRTLTIDESSYQLANASDWDSTDVDKSVWCTRGWTFQELVLSRRVLVFTPTEVLFYCSNGFQAESMNKRSGSNYESRFGANVLRMCNSVKPQITGNPTYSIRSVRHNYETVHWNLLNDYLGRKLSFDTDILAAFAGVLNAEGTTIGHSFWGLPFKILARALFWDLNNISIIIPGQHYFKSSEFAMTRRKNFPSWSWTGWKISQNEMFSSEQKRKMLKNLINSETFAPLVHIYHIDEELGEVVSLMGKRSETEGIEGFHPRQVERFNQNVQFRKQQGCLNTQAMPSMTHFRGLPTHCMIFLASCATFVVSSKPESRDQDHSMGLYKIYTEDGQHRGREHYPRVWLNIEWREQQDRRLDFVLIGVDVDRARSGWRSYYALLIQQREEFAERVAIPQPFTLEQWQYGDCTTQWIALG